MQQRHNMLGKIWMHYLIATILLFLPLTSEALDKNQHKETVENNIAQTEESATPTTSPEDEAKLEFVKKLSPIDRRIYQTSVVEFELLAQRKQRGLTEELRSQLVFNLERLVTLACMPSLSTELSYTAPPQGSYCNRYLDLLKALLPSSPVIACAEHGINSDSCGDAFNSQYISSDSINEEQDKFLALDYRTKLESAMFRPKVKDTESLSSLEQAYEEQPNPENKNKLLEKMTVELSKSCADIYMKLVDKQPAKTLQAGYVEMVRKDDPLVKMIEGLGAKKNTDSEKTTKQEKAERIYDNDYKIFRKDLEPAKSDAPLKSLWRVRYISKDCLSDITRLLEIAPAYYSAVCYREGFYSPNCIKSKIAFRQAMQSSKHKSTTDKQLPAGKQPLFTTF